MQRIEDRVPATASAAGALYALAVSDVATLAAVPHNVGALYLSPEVQHGPYASFQQQRSSLQAAYGRLGGLVRSAGGAMPALARIGAVLIQLASWSSATAAPDRRGHRDRPRRHRGGLPAGLRSGADHGSRWPAGSRRGCSVSWQSSWSLRPPDRHLPASSG